MGDLILIMNCLDLETKFIASGGYEIGLRGTGLQLRIACRRFFLRPIQVARWLKISRAQMKQLIASKEIASVRIGGTLLVPREEVKRLAREPLAICRGVLR